MYRWIVLAVVLVAPLALAESPSTQPSASGQGGFDPALAPATQPAVISVVDGQPAITGPTTAPSDAAHFPTPAELVGKMKQMEAQRAALPKVAYFKLGRPIVEKPADFSWFGGNDAALTLHILLDRLEQAKTDKGVKAVLITLGESDLNLSQAVELRDTLVELRHANKRIFVYADSYSTATYIAASGATDVCMLEAGEIMVPGVGLETMFAKGLLDKIGVKADYVQIGEYKGADEQFTRTDPSPELTGELNKLMDSLYGQIVDNISLNRNLKRDDVRALIDEALITGKKAKESGLVDHLVDIDGLRELMDSELGEKVDLVHDYGAAPKDQVDLSSPFGLLALLTKRPEVSNKPCVGLIYAEGVIVDGASSEGLFSRGGTIGSDDIREDMRIAARDPSVKAIVIRIDSPGGSALASEAMWQAVRRVAKTKPVIISVGSMAASGGYYLACSGETIYADPTAIVGSIGVVGGKFVFKDLFEKIGLSTTAFTRGRNADLFSSDTPWTPTQRQMITNWMHDTYDQFTTRVMSTRTGKIKDIDQVARGRIFTASQAKDLGMVDEIGGVQAAIIAAADKGKLQEGQYEVRVIPAAKTLADIFSGATRADAESKLPIAPSITISPDSVLDALPASTRQLLMQQIQIVQLLQNRPVMLVSPYIVTLK